VACRLAAPASALGIVHHGTPWLRVEGDVGDLALAVGGVDGHDRQAQPEGADVGPDNGRRGRSAEEDPVAGTQPGAMEAGGHEPARALEVASGAPSESVVPQRRPAGLLEPAPGPAPNQALALQELDPARVQPWRQVRGPRW